MNPGGDSTFQTVAFADLETEVWGAAVTAGARAPMLVVGADGHAGAAAARAHGGGPYEDWRLTAEGIELVVTAAGEPVAGTGSERGQQGFDQLCRVEGWLTTAGGERHVATLGIRGVRDITLGADGFGAVREAAAWFEPGDGLALAAFRPRDAKGQDADVVSAAVLDSDSSASVEDARLSTTYAADGWVARAGLELWLGGDEDQQFLRRATGEAVGQRGSATAGDLELRAELFRWHCGGRQGAGVYLLASRQ